MGIGDLHKIVQFNVEGITPVKSNNLLLMFINHEGDIVLHNYLRREKQLKNTCKLFGCKLQQPLPTKLPPTS